MEPWSDGGSTRIAPLLPMSLQVLVGQTCARGQGPIAESGCGWPAAQAPLFDLLDLVTNPRPRC